MSNSKFLPGTHSESSRHKTLKQFLHTKAEEFNPNIVKIEEERYIGRHRFDVSHEFTYGGRSVDEVQCSFIRLKELKRRTADYSKNDVYVRWILDSKGVIVGEPKEAAHKRRVKIGFVEFFLSQVNYGPVYYFDIQNTGKIEIFALYFTLADKTPRKKLMEEEMYYIKHYFIRNAHYVKISDFKILASTNKIGKTIYKIAKFPHEDIHLIIKQRLLDFISEYGQITKSKKFLKKVLKFGTSLKDTSGRKFYFSKTFILNTLQKLIPTPKNPCPYIIKKHLSNKYRQEFLSNLTKIDKAVILKLQNKYMVK